MTRDGIKMITIMVLRFVLIDAYHHKDTEKLTKERDNTLRDGSGVTPSLFIKLAIIRPMVVLPVPGFPRKIMWY